MQLELKDKWFRIKDLEIPEEVWEKCCEKTARLKKTKQDYVELFNHLFQLYGTKYFSKISPNDWGQHIWYAFEFLQFALYLKEAAGLKHLLFTRKLQRVLNDLKAKTWLKELGKKRNVSGLFDLSGLKKLAFPPKPFQLEGLRKFVYNRTYTPYRGIILAFDQGLGKTYTAIMIYSIIREPKIAVVVCPNSLKLNWKSEILKFRPDIQESEIFVLNYDSYFDPKKHKIIIANYESLHKVLSFDLPEQVNKVLIVDETQYARNVDTVRVRNLLKLVQSLRIENVLLLSGTPIKGHLDEFAPYFTLIDPFLDDEALQIFKVFYRKKKADEIFVARLRLYLIRFTKEQVLSQELPRKQEVILNCEIDTKVARENLITLPAIKKRFLELYQELSKKNQQHWCKLRREMLRVTLPMLVKMLHTKGNVKAAYYASKFIELYKVCLPRAYQNLSDCRYSSIFMHKDCLLRLKQIKQFFAEALLERNVLNWTKKKLYKFLSDITYIFAPEFRYIGLALGQVLSEANFNLALLPAKYCADKICKVIRESTKTLIFTKSAKAAKLITEYLARHCKVEGVYITGETKNRFEVVQRFKEDPKQKFLVATYQTLGVGFTITEADTVLIWDLPWREADLRQAVDRIYRIGQTKPVKVILLKLQTDEPNLQDRILAILNKYKEIHWEIDKPTEFKQEKVAKVQSFLAALGISPHSLALS